MATTKTNTEKTSTSTTKTRTTTTAKKTKTKTTAAVKTPVIETFTENENAEATTSEPVATVCSYQSSDLISCKSVCYGKLTFISTKTGQRYDWLDYGDICEVEYADLLSLRASKSKFIYEPWFIIEDEQLAGQWKLAEMYSYFNELESVEEFLASNPKDLQAKLLEAPRGYRNVIVTTVGNMLRAGTFDSITALKAIDATMNTKLSSLVGD